MSPELLKRIDEKRGLIPRATYIENCMRRYFDLNLENEELKFYEQILPMFRKLMTEGRRGKMLSGLSLISSKIAERKVSIITTK